MFKNSNMVAEEKNTMVEIKMVLVNLRIFPFFQCEYWFILTLSSFFYQMLYGLC